MDIIELYFVGTKASKGKIYKGDVTEQLEKTFRGKFTLCRNSNEPIIRLEYDNKGIADFTGKPTGAGGFVVDKCSLYLCTLSILQEFNTTSKVNKLYRILKEYENKIFKNLF